MDARRRRAPLPRRCTLLGERTLIDLVVDGRNGSEFLEAREEADQERGQPAFGRICLELLLLVIELESSLETWCGGACRDGSGSV